MIHLAIIAIAMYPGGVCVRPQPVDDAYEWVAVNSVLHPEVHMEIVADDDPAWAEYRAGCEGVWFAVNGIR
jgi:hypothetical protein